MDFYTILNGIRQTLRMAAVRTIEIVGGEAVEVITPVIRLAGTEAANGVVTFTLKTVSGPGVVPVGCRSVAFANSGTADATLAGGMIPAGVSIPVAAPVGAMLAPVPYDATGTTLMIAEVR
jgi:hypothetical protein